MAKETGTTIHASAPVRLDFAGGWTDVPPFSAREGGIVVNGAIQHFAHAEVTLGGTGFRLSAEDLGARAAILHAAGLEIGGPLGLLKAALRMLPVGPCALTTRVDTPPGSGLGSSGALDVALVTALSAARGEHHSPIETAEQAWHLEVVEAKIPGGRQDQMAAAVGGFSLLKFDDPEVRREPLALDPAFLDALARQTVLCYTGTSRVSGETITRVMAGYERGDPGITGALRAMKELALAMAEALRGQDLVRVGALLAENWSRQQELDPIMRTEEMARLERLMNSCGAIGGKAAGAGAGGSMFFLVPDDPVAAAAAARAAGASVLPVTWAPEGARTW